MVERLYGRTMCRNVKTHVFNVNYVYEINLICVRTRTEFYYRLNKKKKNSESSVFITFKTYTLV